MIIQRIKYIFLFLTFFLIPFLGGNDLPLFYITIGRFWIENLFLISTILSLLLVFLDRENVSLHSYGKFLVLFVPFFLCAAASYIFTWNRLSTLKEINTLVWVLGVVSISCFLKDRSVVLKVLVAGAVVSAACEIYQFIVLYPKLAETLKGTRYAAIATSQPIPFSSFLYHNILGGYLASVLPLSLYFAMTRSKLFYSAAAVIIFAGVVLTTSRIAMGLSVVSFIIAAVVSIKASKLKGVFRMIIVAGAGLFLSVALMNIGKQSGPQGVQKEISRKMAGISSDVKTLNTRTEIWKGGAKAFTSKPVFGHGAGTFEYAYRKYYDGGFATKHSHSSIIKIGVELGAVGILCWLFYLAGFTARVRGMLYDRASIHILMGAVSIFIFGLLDFSFDTPAHVITFYTLGAVLLFDTVENRNKGLESHGNRRNGKIFVSGALLFLTVLLGLSFFFTTRMNLASKAVENGTAKEEIGFPPAEIFRDYEYAAEKMPLNNDTHLRAAGVLIKLYKGDQNYGTKEKTKQIILRYLANMSKRSDRDSEMFHILGIGYWVLDDFTKAEYYLKQALSYLPSSSYYTLSLAEFYFRKESYDKALQVIHSFDRYLGQYEATRNPNGFYVYKFRDLEVEIKLRADDRPVALALAVQNQKDAERERFIISSVRARSMVEREPLLKRLRERVRQMELSVKAKN